MTTLDHDLEFLLVAHEAMVRHQVDLSRIAQGSARWQHQKDRTARATDRFERRLEAFKAKLPDRDRPPSFSRQENDFA